MYKVNYHIHTTFSDGENFPREYVLEAIKNNINEIGFTDHLILLSDNSVSENSIKLDELERYVREVESLKREFDSKIKIKLGIETDYFPSRETIISKVLKRFPFDYIIGSVHRITDEFRIDDPRMLGFWKRMNQDEIFENYKKYFTLIKKAASSGLFDIIGHPDFIKSFGFKPDKDFSGIYIPVIKAISENKICVEVNSSGLRKPIKEIYPSIDFLRVCLMYDVPITLGNDAHNIISFNSYLDILEEYVKKAGYNQIALFEGRKRCFRDI